MDKITQAINFAKQNPDSQYATELRKRIESGSLDKELHSAGLSQYATAPKQDGIVKAIAKDVASTLVVKPVARTTEAVTRLAAPNSMAAKGYEQMAQEGQSQNIGGMEIAPQKGFGEGGGKQIAGETLKIGSYLFPYGTVAKGVGTAVGSKVAGNVISGATGGYMADVASNIEQGKESVLKPGLGTVIGAAIPVAGAGISGAKSLASKIKPAETVDDTIGRILQGKTTDIPKAKQALANIDTTGVKTREELSQRIAKAKESLMQTVDTELAKDTRVLPLDNYSLVQTNKAGEQVKTNVVQNAFNDLKELFRTTGDELSVSNLNILEQKALNEGLTRQEVNNIARMYSEEFGTKAFNKLGDPLTSVNAQRFQNTRSGLKAVSRMDDEIGKSAQSADRLYSAMENTQKLIDAGIEGVNKLQQRVKERGLLEKLARNTVNVLNTLSGGTLKGAASAVFPSNVGLKTFNWLDLEKQLGKDLEFINKANSVKSDSALVSLLNQYASKVKLPGDAAVDDIGKTIKGIKSQNPQAGFIKVPGLKDSSDNLIQEAKKYKSAEEFVKAQKQNPIYKNFTQDIIGKSKVNRDNLLNAPDSGRYAWRAGRDASILLDNADLPDSAFRSIVGKTREEIQKSLDDNLAKYATEKNIVPPTDIKKIDAVIKYAKETKFQLEEIWKKANQRKSAK